MKVAKTGRKHIGWDWMRRLSLTNGVGYLRWSENHKGGIYGAVEILQSYKGFIYIKNRWKFICWGKG